MESTPQGPPVVLRNEGALLRGLSTQGIRDGQYAHPVQPLKVLSLDQALD